MLFCLHLTLTEQQKTGLPLSKKKFNMGESDIVPSSGVARTSSLLGHSVGTLRLYKLPRELQKLIGGFGHGEGILSMVWGHPPPKI